MNNTPWLLLAITSMIMLVANDVRAQDSSRADLELERQIVAEAATLQQRDLNKLGRIGDGRPLEPATLDRIAQKMSLGMDAVEASVIRSILIRYQKHTSLPDKMFYFLVDFMTSLSETSYVAADVLEITPETDSRRADAILAVENKLRSSTEPKEVLYSIAFLERFQRHGALLESTVPVLIDILSGPYEFQLRKRALQLAMTQEIGSSERRIAFDLLLREIDTHDDPTSREAVRARNKNAELYFILESLVSLSDQPHSRLLINVLISHSWRYLDLGLPLIVQFSNDPGLSDAERESLERWATRERKISHGDYDGIIDSRLTLFNVLWPPPTDDTVAAAMLEFDSSRKFGPRCRTIYDIKRLQGDSEMPGVLAESLFHALQDDSHPELRYVGAAMLLESAVGFDTKEQWLLELIAQRQIEPQLYDLFLDGYEAPGLQEFVAVHATNLTLPTAFRENAIRRLGAMANDETALLPRTEDALRSVALSDPEMQIGTAEGTLGAWGVEAPLSDRAKQRNMRTKIGKYSDALFRWLSFIDIFIFVYGLLAIGMSGSPGVTKTSRIVWSYLGWLLLAALTFIAWGFGLLMSFGLHGGGAPPQEHFVLMLPFYLLSILMLILAIAFTSKIFRNRQRENAEPSIT